MQDVTANNKRALKNTPSFKAPPGIFNNGGRGGKEVPPLARPMPTIWHDSCFARIIPGFQYFLARFLQSYSWHGYCKGPWDAFGMQYVWDANGICDANGMQMGCKCNTFIVGTILARGHGT